MHYKNLLIVNILTYQMIHLFQNFILCYLCSFQPLFGIFLFVFSSPPLVYPATNFMPAEIYLLNVFVLSLLVFPSNVGEIVFSSGSLFTVSIINYGSL